MLICRFSPKTKRQKLFNPISSRAFMEKRGLFRVITSTSRLLLTLFIPRDSHFIDCLYCANFRNVSKVLSMLSFMQNFDCEKATPFFTLNVLFYERTFYITTLHQEPINSCTEFSTFLFSRNLTVESLSSIFRYFHVAFAN